MNNINQSSSVKTKNSTSISTIGWIVGIITFTLGITVLTSKPLAGISYFVITCMTIPPLSAGIQKKIKTNLSRNIRITLVVALFLYAVVSSNISTPPSEIVNNPSHNQNQVVSQEDKDKAKKELDDLMALGKKSGLVTSYEFSDTATVVYVSKYWYTQTVVFKKDFLAKVSYLKEKMTGYRHFKVIDAYSNEKVAEVTAFTGAFEVYK